MDENFLMAVQQNQGGAEGTAGAAAGAMDSGDWRDELLLDSRQRIINKIMEILEKGTPVHGQDRVQELMKGAVMLEENMYNAATSLNDYMRKISLEMMVMEIPYTKFVTYPLHPDTASSGQNAHGPETNLIKSEIEMDGNNLTAAQTRGDGEGAAGAMDSSDWRTQLRPGSRGRLVKKIMKDFKRLIPVFGQDGEQKLMKTAVMFEEKIYNVATSQREYLRKISLEMLKLDARYRNSMTNSLQSNTASSGQNAHGPERNLTAAQTQGGGEGATGTAAGAMVLGDWRAELMVDSRQRIVNRIMAMIKKNIPVFGQDGEQELMKDAVRFEEKIYNVATSQYDYLRKICFKMLTMTNALQPNTASSGQNAHGPEMTMEAAAEDMSKEDVVEEAVVKTEQNYVVGHKENVRVGENEKLLSAIDNPKEKIKLDPFDGSNFIRWKDKIIFLRTALKIFHVLDPLLPAFIEPTPVDIDETKAERKKREEDEQFCRGHILKESSSKEAIRRPSVFFN